MDPRHEFREVKRQLICYPDTARRVSGMLRRESEALSLADIKIIVFTYFGVREDDIITDRREPCMVTVRHIAMYFCHRLTTKASTQIGMAFRRDHTTALYGIRKITASGNETIKKYVDELAAIFGDWQ